jgi:hypothetical protein
MIRPTDAGDSGERPDIMVDVKLSASDQASNTEQLRVPIEIKGAWHPAVRKAQWTQLAKRYLSAAKTDVGVYLVGWYPLEQWDASNDRGAIIARRHGPVDKLRSQLTDQASEIRLETGLRTFPYVLEIPRATPQQT